MGDTGCLQATKGRRTETSAGINSKRSCPLKGQHTSEGPQSQYWRKTMQKKYHRCIFTRCKKKKKKKKKKLHKNDLQTVHIMRVQKITRTKKQIRKKKRYKTKQNKEHHKEQNTRIVCTVLHRPVSHRTIWYHTVPHRTNHTAISVLKTSYWRQSSQPNLRQQQPVDHFLLDYSIILKILVQSPNMC